MLMYRDVAVHERRSDFGRHRADYALRDFHPAWLDIPSGRLTHQDSP